MDIRQEDTKAELKLEFEYVEVNSIRIKNEENRIYKWDDTDATLTIKAEINSDSELFECKDNNEDLMKNQHGENIDAISKIDSSRIKTEDIKLEDWEECHAGNTETLINSSQLIKSAIDMGNESIGNNNEEDANVASQMCSNSAPEWDIERNCHVVYEETTRNLFSCYNCNYSVNRKYDLIDHMKVHKNQNKVFPHSSSYKLKTCGHCHKTFGRKRTLDDHTIREHPHFAASVSSKIHECTICTYKTTVKSSIDSHMLKHPETSGRYKLSTCVHCNKNFKSKPALNDHITRKHPDFIASVFSKIRQCTSCTYKTTLKSNFDRHILKHSEICRYEPSTCIHCNATFNTKAKLNEHTIKTHPDFTASITTKIYECRICPYKTTVKNSIDRHMLKHPETAGIYKLSICMHCSATFRSKSALDDHIVKIHPVFIASVSCKIHQCSQCTYKTTLKSHLDRHMLKHSKTACSKQKRNKKS